MTKFLLVPKTKGVDKLKLQGHLDLAACSGQKTKDVDKFKL